MKKPPILIILLVFAAMLLHGCSLYVARLASSQSTEIPENGRCVSKVDGLLYVGHYKDSKLHGWEKVYRNDTLLSKKHFRRGVLHGKEKSFIGGGKSLVVTPYVNGERHGTMRNYDLHGNLYRKAKYEHGKMLNGEIITPAF